MALKPLFLQPYVKNWSWPVSRVLSWTIIPLDARSPMRSSDLPAGSTSSIIACLFGLAPDGGYRVSP